MSIGERITALRSQANLSQGDLAKALDISRQAVSKWENDLSSPDTLNLIKLAEVLDTDVEYLATGRNSYGRRPPIVLKTTETVEKIVEKPVVQIVEKVVEKVVEKPILQTLEKPVVKKVVRIKYRRDPVSIAIGTAVGLLVGIVLGLFL